jgi:hypothetical protein
MNKEVSKILSSAIDERHAGNNNRAFLALYDAITVLNESSVHKSEVPKPDPCWNPCWKPEELAQKERPLLTLDHLKEQVDAEWKKLEPPFCMGENTTWLIGDFEIRRRK